MTDTHYLFSTLRSAHPAAGRKRVQYPEDRHSTEASCIPFGSGFINTCGCESVEFRFQCSRTKLLVGEFWICYFPQMTVKVGEVTGIPTPKYVLSRLDYTTSSGLGFREKRFHLVLTRNVVG